MFTKVWLGIDLGTSGCRIIAINDDLQVVNQVETHFPLNQPYPNPAEQWQIIALMLKQSISELTAFEIASIAVDATSGSIMLCALNGQPLTDMLLYNDDRAVAQSRQISVIAPCDSGALGASSGLAKLLFLQQNTDLPRQYYLVHQADWIASNLGAKFGVTDYNNALKSGFDPQLMQWPDWLQQLTQRSVLPEVVAPGTLIGEMPASLMTQLGLKQSSVPKIIAGTTDSIAAFIATGATKMGDGVTSLGSTLVLKLITKKPVFDSNQGIYSHKLGKHWLVGGASNSGGGVLQQFFTDTEITLLSQNMDLDQPPPDYYPLPKVGERFPVADPQMLPRLSPRPDRESLFLHGLLNGIANIEKQGYDKLQQLSGTRLQSLRSVGGGATNPQWTQIRKNKLTVPFLPVSHPEAAYGAALLAKNGSHIFNGVPHG